MKHTNSHIAKHLQLIKLTKILVVCLLGLCFALEFALLNLISAHKEQRIVITISYEEVSGGLVAVYDTVSVTISKEFQDFLNYIKKKYEEQNRKKTENHQFTAFNLFCVDRFSFRFERSFCVQRQSLNACYKEPFTQKAYPDIFHPPKA